MVEHANPPPVLSGDRVTAYLQSYTTEAKDFEPDLIGCAFFRGDICSITREQKKSAEIRQPS